jgi:sugar phosphate isomerase/epimerase
MKLGFFTAALPGMDLAQVANWAAESKFQTLEIACWPAGKAERRYAGVSHIDVSSLDQAGAKEIRSMLRGHDLEISSLGFYPNPLHPDADVREGAFAHIKKVVDAAVLLEVEIVGTFIGADQSKSAAANLETFAKLWPPIITYAGERGIKIAIENCPMLWHDTWPGGQNVAYSPSIWKQMFEIIPDDNFGLNYDPSHLIWQFIDEIQPIRDFRDRIFHVHAKDMEIDRAMLARDGILSAGVGWAIPRLPGLGETRWSQLIAALYAVGYDYVISIEHEDRAFEKTEDLVKRGFYLTRDYLRPWIV